MSSGVKADGIIRKLEELRDVLKKAYALFFNKNKINWKM